MEKQIKIILAALLLLCLLNMPYGYYQFVRFSAMIVFAYLAYLAYSANEQNRKNDMFIYITLALLFQPFIKIALGRTIWNIVDLIVGIGLLISLFKKKQQIKVVNDKK
jgi:predicted membrane protein